MVDAIALSTDTRRHLQLMPLVCAAWRKFFPHLAIDVSIVENPSGEDNINGPSGIIDTYGALADRVTTYPCPEGIDYANACKLARLWSATLYSEKLVTINDMDLVPLQEEFYSRIYSRAERGKLLLMGEEVYRGNPLCEGRAPMSAATADGDTWREILNPAGLGWPEWCRSFIGSKRFSPQEDPSRLSYDFSDEALLRALIDRWAQPERIIHIERGYDIQRDTLDRAYWRGIDMKKLVDGGYKEGHLFKPLYHHAHRRELDPLIRFFGVEEFYRSLDSTDPEAHRFLLIQEDGRYEENREFREFRCLKRAIDRLPNARAELWGKGLANCPEWDTCFTDQFDTILVVENYDDEGWLPDLSSFGQRKLFWSIDAHKAFERHTAWCIKNKIDLVLVSSPAYVEKFRARGLNAVWCPNRYPKDLFSLDVPSDRGDEWYERDSIAEFVGSRSNRGEWIDELSRIGMLSHSDTALGSAMVCALATSRIGWNRNEADDVNYRTLEVCGAGAMLLTNKTPGLELMFDIGREVVTYDSLDDCKAKLRYYLDNPEEARAIAEAGRAKVESRFTYDSLASTLVSKTYDNEIIGPNKRPLLALNMIVKGGEAEELDRCLDSFSCVGFDEIIIVNTGLDPHVAEVAQSYGARVIDQPWADEEYPEGSFARARNAALDATMATWWMWLDADDGLLPESREAFRDIRLMLSNPAVASADVVYVPYAVAIDLNGKPLRSFLRERIIRTDSGYRWREVCHEQLLPAGATVPYVKIDNAAVTHLPSKPWGASAQRNVRMLRWALENDPLVSKHARYYLARDLLVLGTEESVAEGLAMLDTMLRELDYGPDTTYSIAWDLVQYYGYGRQVFATNWDELTKDSDRLRAVEKYARIAIAAFPQCAEPYVVLGDRYYAEGSLDIAEELYRKAASCSPGAGMLQSLLYYEAIPADRLCNLLLLRGDKERALYYDRLATAGGIERAGRRKMILDSILSTEEVA